MSILKYLVIGTFFCLMMIFSCKDDEIITERGAGLSFSTDTVLFDTVLTTFGSVTKRFKIYNPHDQDIVIQEIYLGGGSSSCYDLNVDGTQANVYKDVKIRGKDSIYVFVEVTIDPLGSNLPLVVDDSVVCMTNGNVQSVKLVAFGQDVNLFENEIIKSQTWTSQKPYLIYRTIAVDMNEVLKIEEGTVVYLHNNASLVVWGRLESLGTLENPITFTGDRFDGSYGETAGQWGTIAIDPRSKGSQLEYVIIKNASVGLQVGYPNDSENEPSVELRNCMILNSSIYGISGIGANIRAYNTIVADCGDVAVAATLGGNYAFYHCTISNISASAPGHYTNKGYKTRNTPSIYAINYYKWQELDDDFNVVDVTYHNDLEAFNFYNSVIYGVLDQEIKFDDDQQSEFNYKFDHCLLKNNEDSLDYSNTDHFVSIILNKDPLWVNDSISEGLFDFQPDTLSPAIDSGSIELIQGIPQVQSDFQGRSRTADGKPDLGAYERYE